MAKNNSHLKAGRPRVAQKWATKMVHSLYLSFEDDRDLHTLLYTCGVDSLDTIKRALREYIANHNHQSGDPAFQAEIAAKALGINIGVPQAAALSLPTDDLTTWAPTQPKPQVGIDSTPVIAHTATISGPPNVDMHTANTIISGTQDESADAGNDNLASRWLNE